MPYVSVAWTAYKHILKSMFNLINLHIFASLVSYWEFSLDNNHAIFALFHSVTSPEWVGECLILDVPPIIIIMIAICAISAKHKTQIMCLCMCGVILWMWLGNGTFFLVPLLAKLSPRWPNTGESNEHSPHSTSYFSSETFQFPKPSWMTNATQKYTQSFQHRFAYDFGHTRYTQALLACCNIIIIIVILLSSQLKVNPIVKMIHS